MRSRFCRNRSKGFGEFSPTSKKWIHATLLAIYNLFGINTKYKQVVAYNRYLPNVKEALQMTLTFVLAVIGWIIFRAESMSQALRYLYGMLVKHPLIGKYYNVFG